MDSSNIQRADARDWQDIMKNRSRLKMHELIERLGLRAKWSSNKRGKTNFDSPLVKELVNDMTNVVTTVPKEADELIPFLAAPDSLNSEVDMLLNKHGSVIWGRMGDREHLVMVGEPEVESFYYPRDLYFENEEDRALIRILLHWWIGLKACNVILARDRLDRERRKKEERLRARDDTATPREPNPTVPIAPFVPQEGRFEHSPIKRESAALPYSQPPRHVKALRLDTTYSNPGSPMSGTPLNSNDSPIHSAHGSGNGALAHFPVRDINGSRRPSGLSQSVASHVGPEVPAPRTNTGTPPLPSLHQLSSELGNMVSNFLEDGNTLQVALAHTPSPTIQAPGLDTTQGDTAAKRGLDLEALQAFRRYIYPGESGPKWDELGLLRRLETAWRDTIRTSHSHTIMGDTALFAARDRAFLTWIELRRHLADLDRANLRWSQEGDQGDLDARIAQHKTLMSASRDLVRNWEDIGQGVSVNWMPEGLTADGLLVQAFVLLAKDSATADMVWGPMNVSETVQWLKENLEQFAAEEVEVEDDLLYVRT